MREKENQEKTHNSNSNRIHNTRDHNWLYDISLDSDPDRSGKTSHRRIFGPCFSQMSFQFNCNLPCLLDGLKLSATCSRVQAKEYCRRKNRGIPIRERIILQSDHSWFARDFLVDCRSFKVGQKYDVYSLPDGLLFDFHFYTHVVQVLLLFGGLQSGLLTAWGGNSHWLHRFVRHPVALDLCDLSILLADKIPYQRWWSIRIISAAPRTKWKVERKAI